MILSFILKSENIDSLRAEIKRLLLWAELNKLKIIFLKCGILDFCYKKHTDCTDVFGILFVCEHKDLMVIVDYNFKFDSHVRKVYIKSSLLNALIFQNF